jgi:CheY-like chemotaxis protein
MRKILLVDDDAEVALLLKAKFERAADLEVTVVNEARDAVNVAEAQQPDIIMLDIDMPEMDGTTVAAALAKNDATKAIPVLFLSSLVTPTDVARGVKAGGKPMLSKQLPVAELIRGIDAELFKAKR